MDTQQFVVQGLAGFIGGLLSVSIGAWLTGLYKLKGEITARAEGLDNIVREVREKTKTSEETKIATRLEKLDRILPEIRAVTETQKKIEASIAGGEWDRQWRLSQIRDSYGRLIAAIGGLQDCEIRALELAKRTSPPSDTEAREADELYRTYAAEYKIASALTRIFAGPRATNALDEYESRRHRPQSSSSLP